jgi:hypothetical protein
MLSIPVKYSSGFSPRMVSPPINMVNLFFMFFPAFSNMEQHVDNGYQNCENHNSQNNKPFLTNCHFLPSSGGEWQSVRIAIPG